jgi:hypothetical protein
LKIISKRGKKPLTSPGVSYKTEVEYGIIIIDGHVEPMTPDEQKAVEDMFDNIRKQLEDIGNILTP